MDITFVPTNLKVNYTKPEYAVADTQSPVFSWGAIHAANGSRQKAYRVVVIYENEILWDSGFVESSQLSCVYSGMNLPSGAVIGWSLELIDSNNNKSQKAESTFKTACFEDFEGQWISSESEKEHEVIYFKKDFGISKKPCRAVLYYCGLGLSKPYLNGNKIDDCYLQPAHSNYKKECYYITINDDTVIEVPVVAEKREDVVTDISNKVFKRYYLGNYYFPKGMNKITFHIQDEDRADTTNLVTTFIDYFSIIEEEFAVNTITTPEDCNVYEEGKEVQFDVTFKGLCPKEMEYTYELVDNWGTTVNKGKLVCRQGSVSKTFYIDKLETGYYKLKLKDDKGNKAYRDISLAVVPKYSERIQGESPFAMDFAGIDVTANVGLVKKLSKAARLAGVQWVRERFQWTRMQPKKEKNYKFGTTDNYMNAISGEGLKISNIFYGNPTWRKDTDLFDLYYAQKAAAERYKDSVQVWELYNEVDGNFQIWSGDTYAAIMKAMSIGVKDSGAPARVAIQGMCRFVEGDRFIDLQTRNRCMDFSDIYNLHYHITENSELNQDIMFNHFKSHRELKFHTGAEAKPFWMTEAGIYQDQKNGALSDDQRQKTARYLVTSTAQSLSTGTSKHFWFLLSPYVESGTKDMGIFDNYFEPSPAYVAEAVMTDVLGLGKYKGQIEMENAEGHVFDSGEGDVLTIWTDEPRNIEFSVPGKVRVTDIMGHEETLHPTNGKVKLSISHYPIYISYDGEMPKEDYYPMSFKHDDDLRIDLSEAERVVIRQEFAELPQELVKGGGYKVKAGQDTKFELCLYNFNNKEMKGEIFGDIEGYEVIMNSQVTIPAMSEIRVPVTLKETKAPVFGSEKYLKFYGVFDGEETSPSISVITLDDNTPEEPDFVNEVALDPKNWDVTNITAGASATATADPEEPGVINFSLDFNGKSGRWFYPFIGLGMDAKDLVEYDGFIYWMRVTSEEDVFKGIPNMFAYFTDGRQYYIGQETGITQETEWVKVKKYWKDMILFTSPLGKEVDIRPFDPALISHIGIGTNPTKNTINYQIKGLGYFKADPEEMKEKEDVEFVTPDLENIRDKSLLGNVEIKLPEGEYKKITLLLTDDVFEKFEVKGNMVYADLSDVPKGKYIFRVVAEDTKGYVTSSEVDITID